MMNSCGRLVAGLALAGTLGMGCVVIADHAPAVNYRVIAGTPIQVVDAPGDAGDVFLHSGTYYRFHAGTWYRRPTRTGSWVITASVPDVFLNIPVMHPSYHVVRNHPAYNNKLRVQRKPAQPPVRPHPVTVRPPRPNAHPNRPPVNTPPANRPPQVTRPAPQQGPADPRTRPEVGPVRVTQKPHAPPVRVRPSTKPDEKESREKRTKVSRAKKD